MAANQFIGSSFSAIWFDSEILGAALVPSMSPPGLGYCNYLSIVPFLGTVVGSNEKLERQKAASLRDGKRLTTYEHPVTALQ